MYLASCPFDCLLGDCLFGCHSELLSRQGRFPALERAGRALDYAASGCQAQLILLTRKAISSWEATPSNLRISTGMVTWPLVVMVETSSRIRLSRVCIGNTSWSYSLPAPSFDVLARGEGMPQSSPRLGS